MAKKKNEGYLSAKESRQISKQNRKITNEFEKKRKRKNVPESEYLSVRSTKKRRELSLRYVPLGFFSDSQDSASGWCTYSGHTA